MKLVLVLSLLASSAFGAQAEFIQVLMSKKSSQAALVIRHVDSRLFFQKCALISADESQVNLESCAAIGAPEGYMQAQIEKRIEELRKQKITRFWIQTVYVLAGIGAGFFGGAEVGAQYAMSHYKTIMYAYVAKAWGGAITGSAAGLTITLLTKNLLTDFVQGGDVEGAYKLLTQNSAQVVVLEDSLSNLVEDLNFALIGIQK